MFVTKEEIQELTGYQRFADQRKWLTNRAWLFETSRTGRPIVSRAYANQKLGLTPGEEVKRRVWKPNLDAIRK
jgi:hypothetical protein